MKAYYYRRRLNQQHSDVCCCLHMNCTGNNFHSKCNNDNSTDEEYAVLIHRKTHSFRSNVQQVKRKVSCLSVLLLLGVNVFNVIDGFQISFSSSNHKNKQSSVDHTRLQLSSPTTSIYTTKTSSSRISVPTNNVQLLKYNQAVQSWKRENDHVDTIPSMFLGTINIYESVVGSRDFVSSNNNWSVLDNKLPFETEKRSSSVHTRTKGVLGFQIGTTNEENCSSDNNSNNNVKSDSNTCRNNLVDTTSNKEKSYTGGTSRRQSLSSLYISKSPSNVDFTSWNWPEPVSLEQDTVRTDYSLHKLFLDTNEVDRMLWPMKDVVNIEDDVKVTSPLTSNDDYNDASVTTTTISTISDDTTTSLQWIPEQSQILSLTVVQLKEELGRRNQRKIGSKAVLQQRFLEWRMDEIHKADNGAVEADTCTKPSVNSLEEWVRTVDLEPLLQRRASIHKEKLTGKKFVKNSRSVQEPKLTATSPLPDNCRETLAKTFQSQSPAYSNLEVKQIYSAAKLADQKGDRELSKKLLLDLKSNATPNDGRLYRRLARMHQEEGNVDAAIAILNEGLQMDQNNTFLLLGLGQLYNKLGDYDNARKYYQDAIEADPTVPNSFHALGTMEHTLGHIAQAAKILKKGIEYSPSNHRLHHAIGDVYREAKVLDMAKKSYLKALTFGPKISHGFAYTALAYTAYEQDDVSKCRSWLQKAIHENSRSSNAWVAWAQLEESEGNFEVAKSVCATAINQYEQNLHNIRFTTTKKNEPFQYRSGDRFHNVYRTWARIESRYGTISSTEDVYKRASVAFPHNWKLTLDWAKYYSSQGMNDEARSLFAKACRKSSNSIQSTIPYKQFAEFEMSSQNFAAAREILYDGISAVMMRLKKESVTDAIGVAGLPELIYTAAVCEWYLGNHERSEVLFQHVLRIIPETSAGMRAFVLFAIAKLEIDRGEYIRAQHCIGLCLAENRNGIFEAEAWRLWSDLARLMGKDRLALQCLTYSEQAVQLEEQNRNNGAAIDMLALNLSAGLQDSNNDGGSNTQLLRRDPWHSKIFGSIEQQDQAASFQQNAFPLPQPPVLSTSGDSEVPIGEFQLVDASV